MSWQRLPTFFPNFSLRMLPLSKEQVQQLRETGWLREVAFRTEPRVNKMEIAALLRSLYGIEPERISTINYEGKKKRIVDPRGRPHWCRETDWKKVYVTVKPPEADARAAEARRQDEVASFERARRAAVDSGVGRQRYELLPLAVRAALAERRDGARRAAAAARGGGGSGGGGGGAGEGARQRGRRRVEFAQRHDGGGAGGGADPL